MKSKAVTFNPLASFVRRTESNAAPLKTMLIQMLSYSFFLRGYWHCGHSWPIVPASGDSEDDCGEAADGM
jgi:hypothetical protein